MTTNKVEPYTPPTRLLVTPKQFDKMVELIQNELVNWMRKGGLLTDVAESLALEITCIVDNVDSDAQ